VASLEQYLLDFVPHLAVANNCNFHISLML
jgi:hypothetical protein